MFTALPLSRSINLNVSQLKQRFIYLYRNSGQRSAQSTILNVKYLTILIVYCLLNSPLLSFSSRINTLECTPDEASPPPSSLPDTKYAHTICVFSISHQPISLQFSLYVLCIRRLLNFPLPSFFLSFFFKLCTSLRNLPPLPLADNPLRKMPLIATLPLVPFQFTLLPLSLFSNRTFSFHFLNRRAVPPNYNTASLTQDLFALRTFFCPVVSFVTMTSPRPDGSGLYLLEKGLSATTMENQGAESRTVCTAIKHIEAYKSGENVVSLPW